MKEKRNKSDCWALKKKMTCGDEEKHDMRIRSTSDEKRQGHTFGNEHIASELILINFAAAEAEAEAMAATLN
jgi:hypothetical protein